MGFDFYSVIFLCFLFGCEFGGCAVLVALRALCISG